MTRTYRTTLSAPNGTHATIPSHIVANGGHIRQSCLEDVEYMAANLRQEDKDEIKAASGLDPTEGLQVAVKNGGWVGVYNEGPWVIWGNHVVAENLNTVWCLATTQITKHRSAFLRISSWWLDSLKCDLINCYTDSRNKEHHRWLDFMRFKRIGYPLYFSDPEVVFYEYIKGI